jgi:hypothetical protein
MRRCACGSSSWCSWFGKVPTFACPDSPDHLKERDEKVKVLRTHLAEGADQAKKGQYDEGYSLGGLLNDLDA